MRKFCLITFSLFIFGANASRDEKGMKNSSLHLNKTSSTSKISSSVEKQGISLQDQKAFSHLKTVLRRYKNRNLYMKITKETYIAAIGKKTVEQGDLYLEKSRKFRFTINSHPSSLMIFDGSHLWYQPDRGEKVVLKFKTHPQIELFSSLFEYEKFFEFFSVTSVKKERQYFYILKPKQVVNTVENMILSCGKNINGVKVLWEGLGNWQYYIFSNLWFRQKLSKSLFVFNAQGFEILESKTPEINSTSIN